MLKSTTVDKNDYLDIDFQVTAPDQSYNTINDNDDVTYVRYIPLPPDTPVPLIHPCEKYKESVKQIREKEDYRKHAKKEQYKQTLINKKKNAKKPVWKLPIQNIERNTPVDDDTDFQIETAGEKNDDGDVIYIRYVPPPPENLVPPMHP